MIEAAAQPELVFTEIAAAESFAPHPLPLESAARVETQYLVEPPRPAA
jgi:hypothetical protein